ncbi:MAG: hypothetical protein QOK40_3270, partial [Miltoncostaeaceae bacterium]|nr:hypothetical protein [Miltoncostaeaceae bacterium]
ASPPATSWDRPSCPARRSATGHQIPQAEGWRLGVAADLIALGGQRQDGEEAQGCAAAGLPRQRGPCHRSGRLAPSEGHTSPSAPPTRSLCRPSPKRPAGAIRARERTTREPVPTAGASATPLAMLRPSRASAALRARSTRERLGRDARHRSSSETGQPRACLRAGSARDAAPRRRRRGALPKRAPRDGRAASPLSSRRSTVTRRRRLPTHAGGCGTRRASSLLTASNRPAGQGPGARRLGRSVRRRRGRTGQRLAGGSPGRPARGGYRSWLDAS